MFSDVFPSPAPLRLLVFADLFGASQQIAFTLGLGRSRAAGEAAVRIVEEADFGPDLGGSGPALELVRTHIEETLPTHLVLSRFGHWAGCEAVLAAGRAAGLPVLFHLDDDLYELPVTVGADRYRRARHPRRAQALRRALGDCDLVIAATGALAERLTRLAGHGRIGWMENGSAGRPCQRRTRPAGGPLVIGYMGSASHIQDLELAAPAIRALAEARPDVRFELFGTIARHAPHDLFPFDVARHEAVEGDYGAFREKLAGLGWDVGLAPLADTPYNRCKTPTKWVEFAEAGLAVAASEVEPYRPMFAAEAALPVVPGGWAHALGRLAGEPGLRAGLVERADALLAARYGWDRLEASLLGLLERARRPLAAA